MVEREEIIKLAKLSKLTMSDEQIETLTKDMQSIISFADMIEKAKCDEPDSISISNPQPLRSDEVHSSYPREEILKNAPTPDDGYFLLPRRAEG